ncbi:unnamed protein product [Staurois parvus]|uniref:Reverse transcriptase domain-containing protein n=1 Tax=Staurois parvus TaxID=386267 RepID=A0ABN9AEW9_9NEOB|nr:unnamed protein product [Staurois parvus]
MAKILFWALVVSGRWSIFRSSSTARFQGRSTFSVVLAVREALERCRADGCGKYLLALDQAKAFDRVDHKYLWHLLYRYGLEGRFIGWLQTLYKGAESFMLVNGWVGRAL